MCRSVIVDILILQIIHKHYSVIHEFLSQTLHINKLFLTFIYLSISSTDDKILISCIKKKKKKNFLL